MTLPELEAIAAALAPVIKAAIARAVDPLTARLDALPAPTDAEQIAKDVLAALPAPKDGKDADPVDLEAIKADLAGMVKAAVAEAIPQPPRDGADGACGQDGKDGRDGADGRDALALDVLPAIDEAKHYPRGSWAAHAGGLWRAYEGTHGMRGWECIVRGVSEFEVEQNGREFVAVSTLSDGTQTRKHVSLPVLLYKQVFKAGDAYEAGDVVTWAGSAWHCLKATDEKPGEGDAWQLMVKRGRDGREVVAVSRDPSDPPPVVRLDGRDAA